VLRGAADMCLAPRARGGLTLCSPWLEYAECPVCRQWEVIIPEYRSPEPGRTEYRGVRTAHSIPEFSPTPRATSSTAPSRRALALHA
jgi:hypothetical protein